MKNKILQKIANFYIGIGVVLILMAGAFILYPNLPFVLNFLEINSAEKEVFTLTEDSVTSTVENQPISETVPIIAQSPQLPPKNNQYASKNVVKIPSIGVTADINTTENSEWALRQGAWMVPDYSNPEDKFLNPKAYPIIMAAHRYGYSDWNTEKREKTTFLNLPSVTKGAKIYIYWENRKYEYVITGSNESQQVEKGDYDLVLYTCKLYNSPIRIFKYAKLTSINGISLESL